MLERECSNRSQPGGPYPQTCSALLRSLHVDARVAPFLPQKSLPAIIADKYWPCCALSEARQYLLRIKRHRERQDLG